MAARLSVTQVGLDRAQQRIATLEPRLRDELHQTVERRTIALQAYVVAEKLSGQVLHVRSGTLRRSIGYRVEDGPDEIRGIVGTNLIYAAIHEYGGTIQLPEIRPRNVRALHWTGPGGDVFAARVLAHSVTIPERSYLRSSLAELAADFHAAVRATIARVFGP